jgi:hypothetical protein
MQKVNNIIVQFLGLALIAVLAVWYLSTAMVVQGSVTYGSDYLATTTSTTLSGSIISVQLLKTGQGSFGSFIQTGAGTGSGNIEVYNATTSNVSLRTGQVASSTILLASIPVSAVANTYIYDIQFTTGLLLVWPTSGLGTTTTTFR